MDLTAVVLGALVVAAGVAVITARRFIAGFTADAVREGEGRASLLNWERTQRDIVDPYNSAEGRRGTASVALAVGVLLIAVGTYGFVCGVL